MNFKFISHTADVQFRAYGISLEKAFSNSALALVKSICKNKINQKTKKQIEIKGKDLESLLYNFLEEFLVLFDAENFILSKILKIKINKKEFSLKAEIVGDSTKEYEIYSHIKAVTYNKMFVKKEKNEWICQVVMDV